MLPDEAICAVRQACRRHASDCHITLSQDCHTQAVDVTLRLRGHGDHVLLLSPTEVILLQLAGEHHTGPVEWFRLPG